MVPIENRCWGYPDMMSDLLTTLSRSVYGLWVSGISWNSLDSGDLVWSIPDLRFLRCKSGGEKDLCGILNRAETGIED